MKSQDETEARFLSPQDLAERWSISARRLDRWRAERYGPAWHQIGGQVRYALSDIETWERTTRRKGG